MSIEIQPDVAEKSQVADKPQDAGKSKGLRNVIIFLLFAAMVAAAIAAWQWYEANNKIQGLQEKFEDRLAEVDSSIEKRLAEVDSSEELRNITGEVRKKREDTDARFKLLEADLTASIDKQKILEGLYQDLAPNRDEATMEEVEQLLLIANQQLRLANNVKSALVALQEADVRLQRVNRPQISPLQNLLAKDMDLLKAVQKVDAISISRSLDSLAETVDQLPLAMEETLPPRTNDETHKPQTSGGILGILQDFMQDIWTDIKKLVRIEHVGEQDIPPPSHSYFLRENLKLRLLAAHNALLARDTVNFKAYLKTSIEWINKHFNNKSKLGTSMLETLSQLHDNEITIDLPNISASYDAVRKYRLATKKETVNASINSKIAEQKQAENKENERLLAEKAEVEAKMKAAAEAKAKAEEAEAKAEAKAKVEVKVGENLETETKLEEKVGGEAGMDGEIDEKVDIESEIEEEVGGGE